MVNGNLYSTLLLLCLHEYLLAVFSVFGLILVFAAFAISHFRPEATVGQTVMIMTVLVTRGPLP